MENATVAHQPVRQYESIVILRRRDVEKKTGLSRSTIYTMITNGTFPKQIHLSARAVGWLASEVDAWLGERVHARG